MLGTFLKFNFNPIEINVMLYESERLKTTSFKVLN